MQSSPDRPFDGLGLYFWSGYDRPNSLVPGLRRIADTWFDNCVRVFLGPDVRYQPSEPRFPEKSRQYNFDKNWDAEVPVNEPFLPNAVRSSHYREAFALPSFKTFVLTAYGSVTHGAFQTETNHLSRQFLDDHADEVREEYEEMVVALYELYRGSGKRFIVCNWETDNELFADNNPALRAMRLAGLRRWFELRREAVVRGRERALALGLSGVEVCDGIEFNNFRFRQHVLRDPDLKDVLRGIILHVKPDYASYSAWESTGEGFGTFEPRVCEDLGDIQRLLTDKTQGATTLILGELGVQCRDLAGDAPCPAFSDGPALSSPPRKAWRTAALVDAARRAEVPIIILWKAYDEFIPPTPPVTGRNWQGEGLIRADNDRDTEALQLLRANVAGRLHISAHLDQQRHGIPSPDGRRWYEIYGLFPRASLHNRDEPDRWFNYEVIVRVEGEVKQAVLHGEYAGQMNIGIDPDPGGTRWFTIQLRRRSDGLLSNEHGPIALPSG